MTFRITVLAEDTTGLNTDNLIQGELHSPAPAVHRLILPQWGAFFEDSLVVYEQDGVTVVDPAHYQMGDGWGQAQMASGKGVYSCFVLKQSAPTDVLIDYQSYGGAQSRNGAALVAWLAEHTAASPASFDYKDLQDLPPQFNPEHHKHLLAHIYGMEYVTGQLRRLESSGASERSLQSEADYAAALERLTRMGQSVDITVNTLVRQFWQEWKETVSLYALGVDLLRNYPALGSGGVYAGSPDFTVTNPLDERYVDIHGLGTFSKALMESVVSDETGLGLELAQERQAQRGSFVGALVGEVFHLPSPKKARSLDYTTRAVYPKDWPDNHPMVVIKQMANFQNLGGVFSAYDPDGGNQYVGMLFNETWATPLIWQKVYHNDEGTAIAEALALHLAAKGAVHEETKDQLGLGKVENLPTVPMDNLTTREPIRNYLTYADLMAYMRLHMESIKLKRKENGEVDYTDTMDKTRVIITTGDCAPAHPGKDQFMRSFCDGTDKYTRFTDGMGGYYDKLSEANSDDCGFSVFPTMGTKVSEYCEGSSLFIRYSNGKGGYFTEMSQKYAESCGYSKPLKLGDVVSVYCSGVDQNTRYADGVGGTYDLPSAINTYLCGGTIYPSTSSGTGGGNNGGGGTRELKFSTTHTRITATTSETVSFYVTGLVANFTYSFDLITSYNNTEKTIYSRSFNADENGGFLWEYTMVDDGVTTARGDYDTWVRIESENLISNHILRSFVTGENSTDPSGDTNAGGGAIGSGSTGSGALNIDGQPYVPGGRPALNPVVTFTASAPTLYVGTTETLRAELTGFLANTSTTLKCFTRYPGIGAGDIYETLNLQVMTDNMGTAVYSITQTESGAVPRGISENWFEATSQGRAVKSNVLIRTFMEGTGTNGPARTLTFTTSRSTVYRSNTYTHSVVLAGATANTNFTIEIKRSTYNEANSSVGDVIQTAVVTTNGEGNARLDYTAIYNGVNPAPNLTYFFFASLVGAGQSSTTSSVTFNGGVGNPSESATITYTSSQTTVRPGDVETLVVSLANFPPNAVYDIEWWGRGANYNGGQPVMQLKTNITVGADGRGSHTVMADDDGVTTPRGEYQFWASSAAAGQKSPEITRTFLASATQPPRPPTPVVITYTSNLSNITPGSIETHSINITGLPPNTTHVVSMYNASPMHNNGMVPLRVKYFNVTSNSGGNASYSFTSDDDGITVPRGTYSCWAEVGTAKSTPINRVFSGTPPPAVTFNPQLVITKSRTTISQGQSDNNTATLTGARPNTAYILEFYMRGPNAYGNQPVRTTTINLVTDSNGRAYWSNQSGDDGVGIPRGTYENWATITSLNLKSNVIMATWVGTPAPTPPPYAPYVRGYSSHSVLRPGTWETHTATISGMRPNTMYNLQFWTQSPAALNNTPIKAKVAPCSTDANGYGIHSFRADDDGVTVPRGTYANWIVIQETGTTSSVYTRVFTN